MVKAGGADRFQRRHAKIDNVDDSLEYRGKNGRAPGVPITIITSSPSSRIVGDMEESGRLPG